MEVWLLLVMSVMSLSLGIWLATVQREQTNWLKAQIRERDNQNSRLLNLLMSRDPMTYATLSTLSTPSQTFAPDEYVGMTDEQEADRWMNLNHGVGDVIMTEELAELGLVNDNS